MKNKNLLFRVTLAMFLSMFASSVFAAPIFNATGPGTVTVTDADLAGDQQAQFTYSMNPAGFSQRTWTFKSTASSTGTVTLNYQWSGFHAYFNVTTLLQTIDANGTNTLISDGPINCCTSPSGGFNYNGQVTLNTVAGQEYGFTLSGSNFDTDNRLEGIFTISRPDRFDKEITSGPDVDANSEIDLVVEVGQYATTAYDFNINYIDQANPEVLIEDTVPAEWHVELASDDNMSASIRQANKKDNDRSATKIDWWPMADDSTGVIDIAATTRGHKRNGKFKPTSCGTLSLNNGAAAYMLDTNGEPVLDLVTGERAEPLQVSNALCLAAVSDVNGDGILARDGSGDEDGDGLSDYGEACGEVRTDPCNEDTDGDGVNDGLDLCPLEAAVVDANGDGCEDPPLTTFSGVATDMPASDLVGWETCYSDTYGNNNLTLAADIQTSCTKANVMLACSVVGSGVLKVAAHALRADVFTDTGTGNIPHNANGVDWYFNDNFSMGFSREGDGISRTSADQATGVFPEERLSWHTHDYFGGGYRCGTEEYLNYDSGWERIVYQAD